MDKPSVYIETSIVSYLAADPSRHPVTLRNQQLTHAWWGTRRDGYALWASELVLREAANGDPSVAALRLALLQEIGVVEVDDEVTEFAGMLMQAVGLPPRAYTDALHIALTSIRGMAYLLTWNCKHIANPALRHRLDRACRKSGYDLPVLCTPSDLLRG
ncbi:MAG TPA: type II toxin-antitoxin system VapC family toxin [Longimicrobium sp.]|nr:type II toxin-antitoxin system VapC family toxin [Longimicrobium sp.]